MKSSLSGTKQGLLRFLFQQKQEGPVFSNLLCALALGPELFVAPEQESFKKGSDVLGSPFESGLLVLVSEHCQSLVGAGAVFQPISTS